MKDRFEAIMASKYVSDDIKAKNMARLMFGDLAHIGDAIVQGKIIEFLGPFWNPGIDLEFAGNACNYRVAIQEVNLGGIMIPKPESEPLKKGATYYSVGLYFYGYGFDTHSWKNNSSDHGYIKSNRIHLTEENAQKHADALNKLHQF